MVNSVAYYVALHNATDALLLATYFEKNRI